MMNSLTPFLSAAALLVLLVCGCGTTSAQSAFSVKSLSLSVSCPALSFDKDTDVDATEAKTDVEGALQKCKNLKTRGIVDSEVLSADRIQFDFKTAKHAKRFNRCVNNAVKRGSPLSSGACTIVSSFIKEGGCDYTDSTGTGATTFYELYVDMNGFRVNNLADLPLNKFLKVMKQFGNAAMEACSVEIGNGDKCKLDIWSKGSAVVTGPNTFSFNAIAGLDDCLQTVHLPKWFAVASVAHTTTTTTTTTTTGTGYIARSDTTDWVITNDDCTTTCASAGGTCNVAGMRAVDTVAKVEYVVTDVGISLCYGYRNPSSPSASLPASNIGYCEPDPNGSSTCEAPSPTYGSRFCCCGDNCPVSDPTTTTTTTMTTTTTTTTASPAGDWVLSDTGASCDTACSTAGGTCLVASLNAVDTTAKAVFVAGLLEVTCSIEGEGNDAQSPAFLASFAVCSGNSGGTSTCAATESASKRFCCCGSNCPTST
eukprot:m.100872 g.100872  ORF g.100872 m.100872 type:complete len:482 (-) comp12561_c1_seq1:731-2176(-)